MPSVHFGEVSAGGDVLRLENQRGEAGAELNLADIFLAQGDFTLAQEFLDGVYPWRMIRRLANG